MRLMAPCGSGAAINSSDDIVSAPAPHTLLNIESLPDLLTEFGATATMRVLGIEQMSSAASSVSFVPCPSEHPYAGQPEGPGSRPTERHWRTDRSSARG